jgi:SAM-dependent methyltransferase
MWMQWQNSGAAVPPRLYDEFASWWPLLSSPADYEEEAAFYWQQMCRACARVPRSILELGSGGGNNASHLKTHADEMTLVDIAPGMLTVSRALNPECEHIRGDMRTIRLGRTFDCVFIHDAVVYMTNEVDLRAAIRTAYVHCRPGGAAVFVPDHVRESFKSTTGHGGKDGPVNSLRYLQWEWDPDPDDNTYFVDFVYMMRDKTGAVRVDYDRHTCGLFGRQQWLDWLRGAGFEPRVVPLDHGEVEPRSCDVFVCARQETGRKACAPP